MKKKIEIHHGLPDYYKHYEKNLRNVRSSFNHDVPYNTYSAILKEFFQEISSLVLNEAFEFRTPARMGNIRVRKYEQKIRLNPDGSLKTTNLAPDWKKTKELWSQDEESKKNKKIVWHTNEHSDGYRYRWFYDKYQATFPNKSAYSFIPTRTNKRQLAKILKHDKSKDYYM